MVSGFLGAGKTTFIKTLAEATGRDFVVLENEYGQTDIDSQMIRREMDLEVYELAKGCVCCTMKRDFAASVLTIANTLDPEVLVVEPTGVARLSSLMDNVRRISYERIELLAPVVIVDGLAFERQLSRADEIFLDQLRHAGLIVVSKIEHASVEVVCAVEKALRAYNDHAEIVTGPYAERAPSWFARLLCTLESGDPIDLPDGGQIDGPETVTLHGASLDSPLKLIALLDAVSFGVFGHVLRAKGHLSCAGAWMRFDVVDGVWGITGWEGEPPVESEVVFIGEGLRRSWLREALLPGYRKNLIGASRALGARAPRVPRLPRRG